MTDDANACQSATKRSGPREVPLAVARSRRVVLLVAVGLLSLLMWSCAPLATSPPTVSPTSHPLDDPLIAAVGDIACPSDEATARACQQKATSDLLLRTPLSAVLTLGDLQYETGRASNFQRYYDPTWGRVKSITRPVPGDHDYAGFDADGYFQYFGAQAGPYGKGYYSFDLGSWHLIA